jgi:hypothetical protein
MEPIYEDRKFMIFNVSELNQINFNEVLESSTTSVRKSNNGLKTFVKWIGETPISVSSLETKEGPYTYEYMVNVLKTEEWIGPDPMNLTM